MFKRTLTTLFVASFLLALASCRDADQYPAPASTAPATASAPATDAATAPATTTAPATAP